MLSHELRNPLAPIRAAAELLRIGQLEESRVQKTSEIIARQVDHMTSLIDDLLDVSRVTRGLVELEKKPLQLHTIVTDAVEQVTPLIRSRRHELTLHMAQGPVLVLGDHKRLVQIIGNLLNNAAKYTPEGGHIRLESEIEKSHVRLSIADDGIGMEPELASRVFELFAQAARTPDRSSGGLGLGLALVKSLVELHNGTVECSSAGLGQGSRFSVRLPLLDPGLAGMQDLQVDSANQAQRPLQVMIVDDNADAALMLAMFLETSGHEVQVEYEARSALARARSLVFDVFLLDIGLPEMDGNELARALRALPVSSSAVLMAVTGYSQDHDKSSALGAGFDHYLVKPVDPHKLLALLADVAASRLPQTPPMSHRLSGPRA